ncbi:PREDICTED: uncharacterized protein LOC106300577 isoform X4 [Brassica oleracea var. oleracea]|uniref:uncharacterized protein LOC106300577 isoform X4 n=1 Tax=Brassica oleracea var. oleracea TaxID=109376 RepID=UPI0006A6A994|nr:PREDICTED: uncharacterized protein LOC106300577 isoform X4 [Brassica oleracea var. oleracea]
MDFHGMNRKNLQILCKKHGIPANLKNIEMANRLASLIFQKEDEETVTETKEEEANLVASRKAKKVRFSHETDNQIFEFTRSVKKSVRTRRSRGQDGDAKAPPQPGGGIELRRSKRSVSKGIGSNGDDVSNSISGIGSSGSVQEEGKDVDSIVSEQLEDKGIQDGRRSTRLAGKIEKSCVEGGTSKLVALVPDAKRSKRIGAGGSTQEEGKDTDLNAPERFEDRDVQGGKRSRRLAAKTEKSFEEGGTSKLVALVPDAKRSKRIGAGGSTQEEGKDTDLNAPERFEDRDVQGGRRSRRLAAKTEKSSEEGGMSKSVTLLPAAKRSKELVDVVNKEDEREIGEPNRKGGGSKVEMVRRRSMRFVNEQTSAQDQRRSVRLKASVENTSMGQAKNDSVKASRVVKGNLVDKKTDENLVKSKRVTRNMKRGRSGEPEVDIGAASNQSNLTPKKTLNEFVHFEQEEACGADVKAGGSSKNQECIKDKPQGIIITEDSPSFSQAKAAEPVRMLEKVLDPTLDKSDDSSQRSNIREINCERMEEECEEKLERETVSMPLMEEEKEEVSPRSLSSPKDKLHVPTGHIIVKDSASTVIAEESTKTKDETLIYSPESELKETSSIAKLANVEGSLENSTERWKEIHSGKDDEKGSLENVQAENLHGNVSECNTESSSAEEEMEISKIGGLSVAHCVNLIPEKLLGEYSQLEPEEAERPNVEARSSSQKVKKIVAQEFVKDKPQEVADDSPSTSETKATEPTVISENVLDSTRTVSGETSAVRNSHELNSEVLEEGREEKHELAMTKKDQVETSSLSEFLTERSEVKTCLDNRITSCSLSVEATLSPASVQLAMSNPEADLGVPTGNDIVSTVITKEETLILTPTSELKEDNAGAKISKVEAILGNSAECCKEDEKGSLEKDVQAENLHVNFSECITEKSSSEEVEISKDGCKSANLTPEKLLDTYTQLVPEEAGGPNVEIRSSSKRMKTVSSECLKENPQGMAEESPSTFVTKTAETLMMSENVSVDISPVGNTQELYPELTDEEREEKQELDIVLVAETEKEKKKASSSSELFVETTPPPPSLVQIAVSNPESELSVPTRHILVKDIVSVVIAEEDIKTEEVPKSVQSFVAKFAETDAVLENSAECSNKSLSIKYDGKGSLEKEKQSAKRHGNFSEYNAENSNAEEEADICKVGRISAGHGVYREKLDEVEDESLMKSVQTISSERGCEPNPLVLSGSLSTEFASHSHKEENVSECLEEEEMKALSQPTPINKAASNELDSSSLFTTPERNLMLMEQLSESGKICEAHIVTQHNDEAVESVVFTTPEKVLLLGDSGLDEVGKEEEHTTTDFPDESDILNTSQNEAFNEGERIEVELHDEPNITASPLRQSSVGDFKEDRNERNEENRTVELHCESGTCTGQDKHDGAENSGGNKDMELYEESVVFTGLEERHELFGDSREDELNMDAQFYDEAGLSTEMHKDLPLADPELGKAGWLEINNDDKSGSLEGRLLNGDSEQKKTKKAPAEFHDESAVPSIPERHPFPEESEQEEAAKSEENNALESQADCDNFTAANVNAKSHDMSDVLTASESHSIMGAFEPDGKENKDVELLGESNISTNEESGQDGKIKYNTAATCEESSFFISPERRHHLGNTEPHTAGKQERKEVEFKDESTFFTRLETRLLLGESTQDRLDNGKSGSAKYQSHHASSPKVILKDDSVARECQVAAPDFRENTIVDSSGSIASKVSYSHEFSAGEVSAGAEFMPKASQAKNVAGLDAIQGTSKQSRGNSPHVDTCHTMGADTIMDAERNVSLSSYVLSLPAEGNSETIGEISNHIEVAGTCSLVSEESGPSTDIQNQIHDAVEELPVTDELIDAKLTKNTQSDSETIGLPDEGDSKSIVENPSQLEITGTCSMVSERSTPPMDNQNHINDALNEELAVTGGSDVSGKTCVLAGTEDEHLGYNSEVTDHVDTAFENDISLTPDGSTLQKNRNEEAAADDEMVNGKATPSPEEALVKPSDNIGESGTLSEKRVTREPILIYRTQAKPKWHDMKENAPNSKIVDNLNVTAPRTSKRQPLQDLRKN